MRDNWVPESAKRFADYLSKMRQKRKSLKAAIRKERPNRRSLTKQQRENVLKKTNSRCHICGGKIEGKWHADHILSHSKGGDHSEDNYLPAHSTCNNYRWDYNPDEFQEIMKLGIWIRTQIINQTNVGMEVAEKFVNHETSRIKRRKGDNSGEK